MFPCLILGSSYVRTEYLKTAVMDSGKLTLVGAENEIPQGPALARLLQGPHADLAFLDFIEPQEAAACAQTIQHRLPGMALIAVGAPPLPEGYLDEAGIAASISYPVTAEELEAALEASLRLLRPGIEEKLILFLPAKAGSGCSTVLLHTAAALAGQFKKRVLVLETDLRSGVLSVMLNAEFSHGLAQVLAHVQDLDILTLNQAIHRAEGVDWLFATPERTTGLPEWSDYFQLIEKVRSYYDYILADLPEVVNLATQELTRRARLIFIVTTPEVLPMRLAKQRCAELERWGAGAERTTILVNRWHQADLSPGDLAGHLARPIGQVFPNDYKSLRAAVLNGKPVPPGTEFTRAATALAAQLCGEKAPEAPRAGGLRGLLKF